VDAGEISSSNILAVSIFWEICRRMQHFRKRHLLCNFHAYFLDWDNEYGACGLVSIGQLYFIVPAALLVVYYDCPVLPPRFL
jgi:hypothetical protein